MKKLIAANWKMNKTNDDAVSTIKELKILLKGHQEPDVLICPPYTALIAAGSEMKESIIKLGAQNMHYEESGAFTGEISALMLKNAGCEYVLIGHSERREFFNEGNDFLNKKMHAALKHGLKPILCIGETLEQRQKNETEDMLETQLLTCLRDVTEIEKVTIAYEPVWAISRGNTNTKPATKNDAEAAHLFIRKVLSGIYDEARAKKVRILYGGSMKPENAKELLEMPNIDGGLVGNASLSAKSFFEIIKSVK